MPIETTSRAEAKSGWTAVAAPARAVFRYRPCAVIERPVSDQSRDCTPAEAGKKEQDSSKKNSPRPHDFPPSSNAPEHGMPPWAVPRLLYDSH